MPEPINYMGMYPQTDPLSSLTEGLKAGALIRQVRDTNKEKDRLEQQRIGFETDFKDYLSAPSSDKILAMQVKYPEMKDRFEPIVKSMDKKQLDNDLSTTSQVLSAIRSGKTDVASQILDSHIEAGKNSGLDTSGLENIKSSLSTNPEATAGVAEFFMANLMGPDKYKNWADAQKTGVEAKKVGVETTQMEELFPSKKKEAEAKAETAVSESTIKGEEAKIAPLKVQADYQKTLEEIKGLQLGRDLDKQRVQIAKMQAQASREGNSLKQQELQLKLMEMQRKFNTEINDRRAEGEGKLQAITLGKNLIDEMLADEDTLRAATGTSAWRGAVPGTKARTMSGKLDQLKNMLTLENIQQLKGSSSDKDMAVVARVGANLDEYQDEDELIKDMKKVRIIFGKAEKKAKQQYGITELRQQERKNISGKEAAEALGI